MQRIRVLTGYRAFGLMWFGQLISLTGTAMSRFALTLWAWQITGQATALALVALFSFGSTILIGPLAGVLVDRWNRRYILIAADLAAGVITLGLLGLHWLGALQVWHLFVAGFVTGTADAFQSPAYDASISLMIPKEHYARANGLTSFAHSARDIAGPILAGILLAFIGLQGILLVDVVTFLFAVLTLAFITIPQPAAQPDGLPHPPAWDEIATGFRYIRARHGLLGLLIVAFLRNLTNTFAWIVFIPMILARTQNNTVMAGTLEAFLGFGGVAGGLVMSAWGGSKRPVRDVLGSMALKSLLGTMLLGIAVSFPLWAAGAFFSAFFHPIFGGVSTALWQAHVPSHMQGRVFAARRVVAQFTTPVSLLMVGPVTDGIFEPAMMPDGVLAPLLQSVIPAGPGAGMALMHLISGILGALIALLAWLSPAIRSLEQSPSPTAATLPTSIS